MFKKLLGLGKTDEQAAEASTEADPSAPEGQEQEPSGPAMPDRPWLSVAFSLTDLDKSVEVRRFAEGLADREASPETIFADFADCDDGLVTVLVHKKMDPSALPPMDEEAKRVLDRLREELSPELAEGDYITIACEVDGAIKQLALMAGQDDVQENLVRDGELVQAE